VNGEIFWQLRQMLLIRSVISLRRWAEVALA
jgi:hypothetical protein